MSPSFRWEEELLSLSNPRGSPLNSHDHSGQNNIPIPGTPRTFQSGSKRSLFDVSCSPSSDCLRHPGPPSHPPDWRPVHAELVSEPGRPVWKQVIYRTQQVIYPRHSMGLPYMPTLTPKTTPMGRHMWQSHGVFGYRFSSHTRCDSEG